LASAQTRAGWREPNAISQRKGLHSIERVITKDLYNIEEDRSAACP